MIWMMATMVRSLLKEVMTMDKRPKDRDPSQWSSMDVQREGGDGFRAAQAAYAEDIAKERAEAERERDFEAFRKTFVAEGGIDDEKVIRAAFETARAEQATQQAVAAEREGLLGERYRLGSLL